jgi:TolA-binding protein
MTEPRRWIEEGPPQAIERLLNAAAAERPPEESMSRALTVLGVGIGTASAASAAGATTAGGAAAASTGKATSVFAASALVKWGLVAGAVTAVGVTGRAVVIAKSEQVSAPLVLAASAPKARALAPLSRTPVVLPVPAPEPAPTVEVVPVPGPAEPMPAVPSEPHAVVPPHAAPAPAPVAAPAVAAPEAPMDAERLAEEVALVDQARGALARGDGAAAIAALDEYEARFTQRKFVPEALYLRMESLRKLGRTGAAQAVAQRLVAGYPKSPHPARARQVLETIP